MLSNALYSLLSGVNANTYPGVTEQEVNPPFIVHAVTKTIPYPSKDGASIKDLFFVRVGSYDVTENAAQNQADNIRAAIDEYSGLLDNVMIERIRFVDQENGYDHDTRMFYTLHTYKIWVNYDT